MGLPKIRMIRFQKSIPRSISMKRLGERTSFTSVSRLMLTSEGTPESWSQRARERISALRDQYAFLRADRTTVSRQPDGGLAWFTFAGEPVNAALAAALDRSGLTTEGVTDFEIMFLAFQDHEKIKAVIQALSGDIVLSMLVADKEAEESLKFADCVPEELRATELRARIVVRS